MPEHGAILACLLPCFLKADIAARAKPAHPVTAKAAVNEQPALAAGLAHMKVEIASVAILSRLLEPFDHLDVELLPARHRNLIGFITRLLPDLDKKGT